MGDKNKTPVAAAQASDNPFAEAVAKHFRDAGVPDDEVDAGMAEYEKHAADAGTKPEREPLSTPDAEDTSLHIAAKDKPIAFSGTDPDKPSEGAYRDWAEGAYHSLTGGTYVNKLFDSAVDKLNRGARAIGAPSADHTVDGKPARYAGATPSQTVREKPVEQARERHPEGTAEGEGAAFMALGAGAGRGLATVGKIATEAAPVVRGIVKPLAGLASDYIKAVPRAGAYAARLRGAGGAVVNAAKKVGADVARFGRDAEEALPNATHAAKLVGRGAQGLGAAAAARGAQIKDNRVEQIGHEFAEHPMSTALIAAAPVIGGEAVGSELSALGQRLKTKANEKLGRAVASPARALKNTKHGNHAAFARDGALAREMGLPDTSNVAGDNPLKDISLDRLAANVADRKAAAGKEVGRTHDAVMNASTGGTRTLPDGAVVNETVGDLAVPTEHIAADLEAAAKTHEFANAPEKAEVVRSHLSKLQPQPYEPEPPVKRAPLPQGPKLTDADSRSNPRAEAKRSGSVPEPKVVPPADPTTLNVTLPSSGAVGAPQVRNPVQPRPRPPYETPPEVPPAGYFPQPVSAGHYPQPAPPTAAPTPSLPPAPRDPGPPATQPAAPLGHYPQPSPHAPDHLTDWDEEQNLLQHHLGSHPQTPAGAFPSPPPELPSRPPYRLNLGTHPDSIKLRPSQPHGFRPSLEVPNLSMGDSPDRWLEEQALGRLNLGRNPQPTAGHFPQPELKGVGKFQGQEPPLEPHERPTARPPVRPQHGPPARLPAPSGARPANPPVEPPANLGARPDAPMGPAPSAGHYPQPTPAKAQPKPAPKLGARPETPAGYYPQPAKASLPNFAKPRPSMEPQPSAAKPHRPEIPEAFKPKQPKHPLRSYGTQNKKPKPVVVNGPKPAEAPTRLNLMQPRVGESFHRAPLGLGSPNLEPDFKQFEQEGPLARLNLGRLPATPAGAFPSRPHNDYDLEQPKLLGPANPPPFPQQVEPNQMQLHRPQLDLGGPSFQAGAPHAPSINLALPEQQGADPSRVNVRPRPMTGIAQPTHAQALLQPQPQSTRTPFQVSSRLRAPDPILPPHRPPPGSYVRPPNTAPKINLLPTEQRVDEPGRYQPKPFPFPAMSGPNVPIAGTGPHPQPSLGHFPQLEEPTLGASLHPQPPAGLNPQPTSPAPPDASQWLHGGVSQMYQPKRNQLVEPLNLLPENKPMRASPGLKLAEPMSPDYGPSHFTLRQADAVQRDLMSELRKHERQNNKPMRPGEDEAMRPIAYGLKAAKKKKLKEAEAAGQLPSNLPADSIGGPSLLTQLDKANAKHELIKGVEDKVAQGAAQEQKGSGSQDLIHKLLGEQRSLHTYGSIAQSVGDVIKSPNMSRGLSAGMSGYKSADYRDANEKLKKEIDEELNVPIK